MCSAHRLFRFKRRAAQGGHVSGGLRSCSTGRLSPGVASARPASRRWLKTKRAFAETRYLVQTPGPEHPTASAAPTGLTNPRAPRRPNHLAKSRNKRVQTAARAHCPKRRRAAPKPSQRPWTTRRRNGPRRRAPRKAMPVRTRALPSNRCSNEQLSRRNNTRRRNGTARGTPTTSPSHLSY